MDILTQIKRLVLSGSIVFTYKAKVEMRLDDLTDEDVVEAIVNAHRIDKTLRSRSRFRSQAAERLFIIKGLTFGNILVYTKGKIARESGEPAFYVLISSKRSI